MHKHELNNLHQSVVFALILMLLSCSRRTVVFRKYLPLEKDKKVIYLRTIDSTQQTYMDTLICREVDAKLMRFPISRTLNLWHGEEEANVAGIIPIHYFERLGLDSSAEKNMIDSSFIGRLLCIKNKKLYVGYGWSKEMRYDLQLDLLFPAKLHKKVDYKHKNGDYWKSFEYTGRETITIHGVVYKDCLRMDIFETFGHSRKIGTTWLAKGIGVVKWTIKNEKVPFIYEFPRK